MPFLAQMTKAFKGQMWKDAADAVHEAATKARLSTNVLRPCEGMSHNIDVNPKRLNVYLDEDFRITKFNIG